MAKSKGSPRNVDHLRPEIRALQSKYPSWQIMSRGHGSHDQELKSGKALRFSCTASVVLDLWATTGTWMVRNTSNLYSYVARGKLLGHGGLKEVLAAVDQAIKDPLDRTPPKRTAPTGPWHPQGSHAPPNQIPPLSAYADDPYLNSMEIDDVPQD